MLPKQNQSLPDVNYFPRDRRAAAGSTGRTMKRPSCPVIVTRLRRGKKACAKTDWRRTTTGSNHISAYGVWRDHARRAVSRPNRTGETRWHRLPGAQVLESFREGR